MSVYIIGFYECAPMCSLCIHRLTWMSQNSYGVSMDFLKVVPAVGEFNLNSEWLYNSLGSLNKHGYVCLFSKLMVDE